MRPAVVIPALNESATIRSLVARIAEVADPIVVDDGSTDETGSIAVQAGADVVRHERNQGYDAALRTGLERSLVAGHEVVITMDGDGQHRPEIVRLLAEPILSGSADLVIGVRSRAARPSERAFNGYVRWRFGVDDILCGMKAYRTSIFERFPPSLMEGSIGTGLALAAVRGGIAPAVVPVPISARVGRARFGRGLRPNARIFAAMGRAIVKDLRRR